MADYKSAADALRAEDVVLPSKKIQLKQMSGSYGKVLPTMFELGNLLGKLGEESVAKCVRQALFLMPEDSECRQFVRFVEGSTAGSNKLEYPPYNYSPIYESYYLTDDDRDYSEAGLWRKMFDLGFFKDLSGVKFIYAIHYASGMNINESGGRLRDELLYILAYLENNIESMNLIREYLKVIPTGELVEVLRQLYADVAYTYRSYIDFKFPNRKNKEDYFNDNNSFRMHKYMKEANVDELLASLPERLYYDKNDKVRVCYDIYNDLEKKFEAASIPAEEILRPAVTFKNAESYLYLRKIGVFQSFNSEEYIKENLPSYIKLIDAVGEKLAIQLIERNRRENKNYVKTINLFLSRGLSIDELVSPGFDMKTLNEVRKKLSKKQ